MRPYIYGFHICCTSLRYTYPRVCKTIDALKDYAKSTTHIRTKEIYSPEPEKDDEEIMLTLPLIKKLTKEFDDVFSQNYTKGDIEEIGTGKNIMLFWNRDYKNRKYWLLDIAGKIYCERFNEVIDDIGNYENCPCSDEFIETCKGITSILKKYSLNS